MPATVQYMARAPPPGAAMSTIGIRPFRTHDSLASPTWVCQSVRAVSSVRLATCSDSESPPASTVRASWYPPPKSNWLAVSHTRTRIAVHDV